MSRNAAAAFVRSIDIPTSELLTLHHRELWPDIKFILARRMLRRSANPEVTMSEPSDFTKANVAMIARWHGITPPNDLALRLVADLARIIGEFEALRGTLRFEDEPASFEAALLEAATIGLAS